jgi:hypothetical protein
LGIPPALPADPVKLPCSSSYVNARDAVPRVLARLTMKGNCGVKGVALGLSGLANRPFKLCQYRCVLTRLAISEIKAEIGESWPTSLLASWTNLRSSVVMRRNQLPARRPICFCLDPFGKCQSSVATLRHTRGNYCACSGLELALFTVRTSRHDRSAPKGDLCAEGENDPNRSLLGGSKLSAIT